ncbi:MAG: hypothetical protein ABSG15_04495 [FCB group bacterium]|jgi:hypothetical protein
MKKVVLSLIVLVLFNTNLFSQFKQGQVELSASAGLGSQKFEQSYSSLYGNSSSSESHSYLMLSVMPGIFIVNGFSFEPEIGMTTVENEQPGFLLLANVSYTYLIPKTAIAPFARIGYGVSNGMGFPNQYLIGQVSDKLDLDIFNIGAGIKNLIGQSAVLRLELNYRSFSQSRSSGKTTESFIALLFGFGIIL